MNQPQQNQYQPTADEQYMLELVNRMRMNPDGELERLQEDLNVNFALEFFDVDLDVLNQQWSTILPAQALAWSNELNNVAINNNEFQLEQDRTGHAPNIVQRFENAGYNWSGLGENTFAQALSIFFGHAAFAIDWGSNPDGSGIQPNHGHRNNIMNNGFREIGISIIPEDDPNTNVGELVITQDFGNRFYFGNSWLLGVAFDDGIIDDDFYTSGEGLAGIDVTAVNTITGDSFTTTTWNAGGYQMQLATGTYDVTFSGDWDNDGDIDSVINQVTIGAQNVKLDLETDELVITPEPEPTPEPETEPELQPEPEQPTADDNPFVKGTMGDDNLVGGDSDQIIKGYSGNDLIDAAGGNDTLKGGKGDDILDAGEGNDILRGGKGGDILKGGKGDDILGGGKGDDTLIGSEGNDTLRGGHGDDILIGTLPTLANPGVGEVDELRGGAGEDTFVLGDETDAFYLGDNTNYALIKDFHLGKDTIELYGSADNYQLQSSGSEIEIYYGEIGSPQDELIGIIQGNISGINLSGTEFTYV